MRLKTMAILLLSISALSGCSKPKDKPSPDTSAYMAYEYMPSGAACSSNGKELFHIGKSDTQEPYPYKLRMDVGYTDEWKRDCATFAKAKDEAINFHQECAAKKADNSYD